MKISYSGTSAAEEQSSNVFISLIFFYYKKTVKCCNVSLIATEETTDKYHWGCLFLKVEGDRKCLWI